MNKKSDAFTQQLRAKLTCRGRFTLSLEIQDVR